MSILQAKEESKFGKQEKRMISQEGMGGGFGMSSLMCY